MPLPSEIGYGGGEGNGGVGGGESEDWKYHAAEFAKGLGEMSVEFGRGCRDVLKQSLLTKNSYVMRNFGQPCAKVCARLRFLNEYLPEDRDPVHAWSVIFLVSIVAIAGIFDVICLVPKKMLENSRNLLV